MATILDTPADLRAMTREIESSAINTNVFKRVTVLSLLTRQGANVGTIGNGGEGRPSEQLFGGIDGRPSNLMDGGTGKLVPYYPEDGGASANITMDGNIPSAGGTSEARRIVNGNCPWIKRSTPGAIPAAAVDINRGEAKIFDSLQAEVDIAMQRHISRIGAEMITGVQTWSGTALLQDDLSGLAGTIADSDTLYGLDRATYTGWQSKVVSNYQTIDLDIGDDANLIQGIADTGNGVDVFITTNALYNKLKKQAAAEAINVQTLTDAPLHQKLGQLKDGFYHNGVLYLYDPAVPSGTAFGLTLEDWEYYVHPSHNYTLSNFKNPLPDGEQGVPDRITFNITTQHMLCCKKPWNQIKYTDLT
jgi:hypothetical protein